MRRASATLVLALATSSYGIEGAVAETPHHPRIVADGIPESLTRNPGDANRGRTIVADRQRGLCLLCHSGPFPEVRLQGTLAPNLAGAGSRSNVAQLRLRIVDAQHLNPRSIMPSYYRTEGLDRVAPAFSGKPILSAQEVEDVVAFLATLQE